MTDQKFRICYKSEGLHAGNFESAPLRGEELEAMASSLAQDENVYDIHIVEVDTITAEEILEREA